MSDHHPGLDGLSVVITGAARGQGALEAELIARSGGYVVVADVLEDLGRSTAERITQSGGRATFVALDVTDRRGWDRVVEQALKPTGRIDALVNNAGISAIARLGELDAETFQRVMQVNVFGAVLGINAVTPPMIAQRGGSIVNVSSIAGQTGWASASYSMSKWAMTGLSRIATLELGPHNVRVNSIHPGVIDTPFAGDMSDEYRDAYNSVTPLGRIGHVEDVAPLVAFLCSSQSAYISGATISIDGGFIGAGAPYALFGRLPAEAQ
jgi:3alpha(or 20beta)-hydroxysteroid dehydrogenase